LSAEKRRLKVKSYGKVLVLDERSHYDFIDKLFLELGKYYEDYISVTYDVPYSYSERTFVGHLAQSACRNGYYSIQDYNVNTKDTQEDLKSHYIPDLHIWVPRKKRKTDTCVFEVKTTYATPIDKDSEERSQMVSDKLIEAEEQLNNQGLIEAQYRCAIVASPIHCAHTKWLKYGRTPRVYHSKVSELRRNTISFLRKSEANFVWTYLLNHENIKMLTWKNEGKTYLPWVGIICAGKVQKYHSK